MMENKNQNVKREGKIELVMGRYAYKQVVIRIEHNIKFKRFFSGKSDKSSLLEAYNQVKESDLVNKSELCNQISKVTFNPKLNIIIYTQPCTQKK